MYNGIINVYKEKGFTSHDVVAKLRGILKQKKIGHTGTLDPDAVGVLPVCLGSGTKLCDLLTDRSKEYEAVMLLGVTTDTEDTSGQIISENEVKVTEDAVRTAVKGFIGEYDQIPPMYSAIKVDGKKLYELAREGKVIERKARRVVITGIEIIDIDLPRVTMRINCGKGTYIRSLCRDIGEKLLCGACMEKLTRTRVGGFSLSEAKTLAEIEALAHNNEVNDILYPVDEAFMEYPEIEVGGKRAVLVSNGNKILREANEPIGMVRVYFKEGKKSFAGVYEADTEGFYKPYKMFLNGE